MRTRRRRSFRKFKISGESLFSLLSTGMILGGVLSLVSLLTQNNFAANPFQSFMNSLFGYGVILIPFLLILAGLMLWKTDPLPFLRLNHFIGLVLLTVSFMGFADLFVNKSGSLEGAQTGLSGGVLGYLISVNLKNYFSVWGEFIILLGLLGAAWVIAFNTPLESILSLPIKIVSTIFSLLFSILKPLVLIPVNILKKKEVKKDAKKEREVSEMPSVTRNKPIEEKQNSNEEDDAEDKNQPKLEVLPPPSEPVKSPSKERQTESKEIKDVVSSVRPLIVDQAWDLPPLTLLSDEIGADANRGDVKGNAETIEKTLESFGIKAEVVEKNEGPSVTQYAINAAKGTKIARINSLSNNLAMALASSTGSVRIEAPIPGKSLIGIEVPNISPSVVTLKSILNSESIKSTKNKLMIALGHDVAGEPIVYSITKMPHVLIAGATGSGKSTMVHALLASILFRHSPYEVKLILVDTKRVELTEYNGIPHLATPVINEPEKVLSALKWAIGEMDRRYRLFQGARVRDLSSYNELSGFQALPYIVIVVDEMADMMQLAPVEVEKAICRLAQLSRATGIHLVLATQRPDVRVITGLIKANIPCRISFSTVSQIDSRVIIDQSGAEKLLGRGDMLFVPPDASKPKRIQGVYVSPHELKKLIEFLKQSKVAPQYEEDIVETLSAKSDAGDKPGDELFAEAVRVVCQDGKASSSLLQRRLAVGYARAARLIDLLESKGVVGPADGARARDVLIHDPEQILGNGQPNNDRSANADSNSSQNSEIEDL